MLKNYYSIYKYGNWLIQHHIPVLPAVLKLVSRIFFLRVIFHLLQKSVKMRISRIVQSVWLSMRMR